MTSEELLSGPSTFGVTQEQPIRTGACLPEIKSAITPPTGTCTIQQHQIEKERLLGSADTNGALGPEKIPRCGLQGQTLSGLDSPAETKESVDAATVGEQAIDPHASSETSSAQAEAKPETSETVASSGPFIVGIGATSEFAVASKPDYQTEVALQQNFKSLLARKRY